MALEANDGLVSRLIDMSNRKPSSRRKALLETELLFIHMQQKNIDQRIKELESRLETEA